MPRFISSVRIVLALLMAGLGLCAVSSMAGAAPAAVVAAPGDTMLPAGWELCVLQGLAAPATQANVDNLDEWQAAEGGSTNNSAAYNPFNTRRTTDLNNAPLPEAISANGFPAFSTWLAGCAATVATMLQPNMWPITAALRAGNVAPPSVFLADVDKSQWCAPSADGTPCYASRIIGGTGELAAALLSTSAALSVYTNVKSDVNAYEQAVATSAVDQGVLTSRNQELAAAQAAVSTAQGNLAAADRALRRFAVDEYVSSGLYVSSSFTNVGHVSPFGPPDANGVAAQQYESITASDLWSRSHAAASAVSAALSGRAAAAAALGQANATLASDTSAENRDLARLVNDVSTLQTAGACTTVQLTVPTASAGAPAAATATTTTVPTTAGTAPATTSAADDGAHHDGPLDHEHHHEHDHDHDHDHEHDLHHDHDGARRRWRRRRCPPRRCPPPASPPRPRGRHPPRRRRHLRARPGSARSRVAWPFSPPPRPRNPPRAALRSLGRTSRRTRFPRR